MISDSKSLLILLSATWTALSSIRSIKSFAIGEQPFISKKYADKAI